MPDDNQSRVSSKVGAGIDSSGNLQHLKLNANTRALLVELQNLDLGIDIEVGHGKDLEVYSDTIASATTTAAIAAGGAGVITYVYGVKITGLSSTLNTVTVKKGTTRVDSIDVQSVGDATCGASQVLTPDGYIFKTAANEAVNIVTSSGESVDIQLLYWQEEAP